MYPPPFNRADDEAELREFAAAVTGLTDQHEGARDEPWHVSDAPDAYIDGQLRGVVGVELTVTSVEAEAIAAPLSQE